MENIFEHKITLTGSDDSPAWRTSRLERVIGYVCALAEHYNNRTLLDKIEGLNDHEGSLIVKWKTTPTTGEKEFFSKAWESTIANEVSENVEHEIPTQAKN